MSHNLYGMSKLGIWSKARGIMFNSTATKMIWLPVELSKMKIKMNFWLCLLSYHMGLYFLHKIIYRYFSILYWNKLNLQTHWIYSIVMVIFYSSLHINDVPKYNIWNFAFSDWTDLYTHLTAKDFLKVSLQNKFIWY